MTVENRPGSGVLKTESNTTEISALIQRQVNSLLDIPEERRAAVSRFVLWMVEPSISITSGDNTRDSSLTTAQKMVYADPRLELAVDFIGSRLALESQKIASLLESNATPSPILPSNTSVKAVARLYGCGSNAQEISSDTGLSIIDVYTVIRKLKRSGIMQPRTEQFGYARVNEEELGIAIEWNNGIPQKQIRIHNNLTNGRFVGMTNKLIELGIVGRRKRHLTKSQKDDLDKNVSHLRDEGKGRVEIAEILGTTEGVIQSSIRRLLSRGRIQIKEKRFTDEEWEDLTAKVKDLRSVGLTWSEIETRLSISYYRIYMIRQRLEKSD